VARLADVIDPRYLEGLEEWPLETVRAKRDESTEIETGLSYLRRIAQGRLDIVIAEQDRRQYGEDAGDVSALVEKLPTILGEHVHAPGLGRLPALLGPGELDHELERRLETVLPARRLGVLPELPDEELSSSADGLADLERNISSQRRAVFDVIDHLQEEIVRRYCTGEATVDTLLK
jgi:hypothetical protein